MLAAILPTLVLALAPPPIEPEPLPFGPEAWAGAKRVEVRVTEKGREVVYSGVPLRAVLMAKLRGGEEMATLRGLADAVLVVHAADGYQAAVSAAEVAMDAKGEKYLLALERDGEALGDGQGPAKLVVPGDPQHVRWVRMVRGVDLVRLPRLHPPPAPAPAP